MCEAALLNGIDALEDGARNGSEAAVILGNLEIGAAVLEADAETGREANVSKSAKGFIDGLKRTGR